MTRQKTMRFVTPILAVSLLLSTSAAPSQEPVCRPCIAVPATVTRGRKNATSVRASDIASRLQELGGEFRDIVHDCGVAVTKRLEQISFSARACSWGGRYPALLFEPVSSDDPSPLVVLAANGATVEVLFEHPPSGAFVRIFGGLLRKDFDELFFEIREQSGG